MSLHPARILRPPRTHRIVQCCCRSQRASSSSSSSSSSPSPSPPTHASTTPTAPTRISPPQVRPAIDNLLPTGFTFYPNHNSYPVVPVPDPSRMYTSTTPPPKLPRSSVFHYIFPPKRKGYHYRYYPANDPRCIAYVDALTGKELYRDEIPVRAMWLVSGLKRLGLKKGQVVCIFGMNSLHWVEANYATQGAELIVSPANYGYTPEELLHQLLDSGAAAVFVQPELVPTLEKAIALAPDGQKIKQDRIILMCDFADKPKDTPYKAMQELWHKQAVPRQLVHVEDKNTAYLCYSSGTTGKAKGVETSHHNITSQVQAVNTAYEKLGTHDRILGVLPFGHIYGLTLLVHQPMTTGTPVIVLPKFDVEEVFKAIHTYGITWALVVPPMLLAMLHSPFWDKYNTSTLKGVQTGAAPCSAELIEAFEAKFPRIKISSAYGVAPTTRSACVVTQGYGLTETSPVTHVMNIEEGARHRGKIGKIIPTMQARIVDTDTGKDLGVGERGELWVRGTSVMKGYWKNPEATKATFAEGGWFKTGDVATVDKEGYFAIVDRVKELIKYKGYQVPPAELEQLLLTHPKVTDSGVIGVYSEAQATELPRAYIVPSTPLESMSEADKKALQDEVADWVAGKVSRHKRLRGGVVLVDVIPKSPSGKILRKILRERAKVEVVEEIADKDRQTKL